LQLGPDQDRQIREFAVRVELDPEKKPSLRWEVIPSGGTSASGVPQDPEGRVVPGLKMIGVRLPKDRATCKVRYGVAVDGWKTEATDSGHGSAQGIRGQLCVIFGGAHESDGKTAIAVSHNAFALGEDSRVVLADHEGVEVEHSPGRSQRNTVGPIQQFDNEYDVPMSKVKEFRFQTRAYRWAEFDDVALSPRRE